MFPRYKGDMKLMEKPRNFYDSQGTKQENP